MSSTRSIPTSLEDKKRTVRLIISDSARYTNEELLANQLTMKLRLLHRFVTHILFPKIGQFDFISDKDLIITQSIIEQAPINLSRLMMNYMWEATTKKHLVCHME